MDFGMLEPLCIACQVPDSYPFVVSGRRGFFMEVQVEFVYLAEPPPSATSDCDDDRVMPDVSGEATHWFSVEADEFLRVDADAEETVREILTMAGVMYTSNNEFMVQTVLSTAASIVSDPRNRDAEVLLMRVSISCADPDIHRELTIGEDERLEVANDEAEDRDTDEDEEGMVMMGPRLGGLTEVEVKERSVDCVICCEDIVAGSTGSAMPCCHVYHRECIARWLEKSRTCPLCRFELPSTY
ncbi:hypothetical protein ACJRO7_004016 [Eucalyptus globulus]|uniref:RING-type E3 ubiquitin transferase n=1 Tax=Eucalyptus globulus TaxID=34317 RepID=A0ABD3IZ58_EUCGL